MEMCNVKKVDTKEYISILRDIVREGKEAGVKVSGGSMAPFLADQRDYIYFKLPYAPLKKGDMVFYQRDNGQFVMHRIYKITDEGLFIIGDAHNVVEGPVRSDQVFAVVFKVKRKGKIIGPGNFWWEFFEHVWINIIPLRRFVVKLYSIFSKRGSYGKK